ncbi:hypothetical protein D9M71_791850 [compost metagenome]
MLAQNLLELLEPLAAIEHERWAHWQKYLHSQCSKNNDGSLTIPRDLVERWERQLKTPYHNLSQKEKDSDKEQVKRYLDFILQQINM